MKRVVFKTNEAVAYQGEAMESGDHFKNEASRLNVSGNGRTEPQQNKKYKRLAIN